MVSSSSSPRSTEAGARGQSKKQPPMSSPEPIPSEGLTPAASTATPTFEDTVRRQLLDELKRTADKLDQDRVSVGDLKILTRALKELRYAFKVFSAPARLPAR